MPSPHLHHTNHRYVTGSPPSPPKPTPKLLSIFLKFLVMSLILSTFLLFLGLAAILLLLAGSFLHRHRRRLHLLSPPDSLHHLLPPFQYHPSASASAPDDCSICLEYLTQGEICRALPVCDHVFHARCVDAWLTKVPNCPICRTRVRLDAGGRSDSDECKFLWAMGVGSR